MKRLTDVELALAFDRGMDAAKDVGIVAVLGELLALTAGELRTRRAADLTAEEFEAIEGIDIEVDISATPPDRIAAVMSAFKKILVGWRERLEAASPEAKA